MTLRVLDAYSCAGLFADGLAAVQGVEVVCLDNDPRALRHNPHPSILGNALDLLRDRTFLAQFDAVHASPPCQKHSATRQLANAQGRGTGRAVDLLPQTLDALRASGLPFMVENVERSPLRSMTGTVTLCGSSFCLPIKRHRLFYAEGVTLTGTACAHHRWEKDPNTGKPRPWGVYYAKGDRIPAGGRTVDTLADGLRVMGVNRDHLPWKYLCEGLPPVYGTWMGLQLAAQLDGAPMWDHLQMTAADTLF